MTILWFMLIMSIGSGDHKAIREVVERTVVVERSTERLLQVQTSEYDRDGRLRRQRTEMPVIIITSFHYENGVLTRVEQRDEHQQLLSENRHEYDAAGRPVKETQWRGDAVAWRREIAYEDDNSRIECEFFQEPLTFYPLLGRRHGIPPSERQISRFDPDGQVRDVQFLDRAGGELARLRITYDAAGRASITELTIFDAESLTVRTEYVYDANGAVVRTTTSLNGELLEDEPPSPQAEPHAVVRRTVTYY